MEPSLHEYEHPGHLVEGNVLVKRQKVDDSQLPEECDGVPQHEYEQQHGVEVEPDAVGPGQHDEHVGRRAVVVLEGAEDGGAVGEDGHIHDDVEGQEDEVDLVDHPVVVQVHPLGADLLHLSPPLLRRTAPLGNALKMIFKDY